MNQNDELSSNRKRSGWLRMAIHLAIPTMRRAVGPEQEKARCAALRRWPMVAVGCMGALVPVHGRQRDWHDLVGHVGNTDSIPLPLRQKLARFAEFCAMRQICSGRSKKTQFRAKEQIIMNTNEVVFQSGKQGQVEFNDGDFAEVQLYVELEDGIVNPGWRSRSIEKIQTWTEMSLAGGLPLDAG